MAPSGFWDRVKQSGVPALLVVLPAQLWLAATLCVMQACVLPLYRLGYRRQYYLVSGFIYALMHRPLIYLFGFSNSKVILHSTDIDDLSAHFGRTQCITMVNHRGDLDWCLGLVVMDAIGGGIGSCKAMIKKELLMVPFCGFVWWAVGCIALQRNWASDQKTLRESFEQQHNYKEENVPYSLTIFPEGTRITPEKLQASQEFSKSRGLPVFQHMLCPRTKGMWSAMSSLKLDSLFDVTVMPVMDAGPYTNIVTLAQGIPADLHIHIDHLRPDKIPKDEEGFGKWLQGRWERKEKRIERFLADRSMKLDDEKELQTKVMGASNASRLTMLGAVCWYFFCALSFAYWCITTDRYLTLFVCDSMFVMALVLMGFVMHKVHFQKSSQGKKTK